MPNTIIYPIISSDGGNLGTKDETDNLCILNSPQNCTKHTSLLNYSYSSSNNILNNEPSGSVYDINHNYISDSLSNVYKEWIGSDGNVRYRDFRSNAY